MGTRPHGLDGKFTTQVGKLPLCTLFCTEPVFLNVYGAQKSIPRNEFRQPMKPGGPVR
jgi:hypothetical protein